MADLYKTQIRGVVCGVRADNAAPRAWARCIIMQVGEGWAITRPRPHR